MFFFVGVVLGDILMVLIFGVLVELVYMGFGVGVGGIVLFNLVGFGIVGMIMVIMFKY